LGDLALRPVRGHHAFEGCVERLAIGIRLGMFPVGSTLPPERELAKGMGVSRATVREAIAALRSAGMLTTTRGHGGGTTVTQRTNANTDRLGDMASRRSQLLDTLVFRRVVEPGAAHIAASRSQTSEQADLLLSSLDQVKRASERSAHRQADSRLHLAIAAASGSGLTIDAVTHVQAGLDDMLSAIPVLDVNIEHSDAQHEAIVHAILRGQAAKARRLMESHCDDTAALLRGLLG
jgi:GntR family transcriptional repressor for pyruvate dehydrogenase complex